MKKPFQIGSARGNVFTVSFAGIIRFRFQEYVLSPNPLIFPSAGL
jgi:hypothetical protein